MTKNNKIEVAGSLEKHIEESILANWAKIPAFQGLEIVGSQYSTDIGIIDILCKTEQTGHYVVIELKRSQGSDAAVGQVLRYMGWVQEHLATPDQKVRGLIIALQGDEKLRMALEPVKEKIRALFYRIYIAFDPGIS